MKCQKIYLFLGGFLLLSLLLSACQPGGTRDTESEDETTQATTDGEDSVQNETQVSATESEPQPKETVIEIETIMATSENGLLINEDVKRSALFNINTLAYEIPGMDQVEAINLTYAYHGYRPLTMDVYYPPGTTDGDRLPVVVFGLGYKMSKEPLRDQHFYSSWGRLVAAAGMAGISYDTEQPDQDLEILMNFIQENAAALRIDPEQVGFYSTSSNPPTVMSYLMQKGRSGIQFAIYYNGLSLTPDRKFAGDFDDDCLKRGCLLSELADVTYVDPEIPLFIVKAGKDFVPNINEAMDYFIEYVRAGGAQVTVIDYAEGVHGFDTKQQTEESAEIIAQTVAFMKENFGMDS